MGWVFFSLKVPASFILEWTGPAISRADAGRGPNKSVHSVVRAKKQKEVTE
jgi:hypothetical protein